MILQAISILVSAIAAAATVRAYTRGHDDGVVGGVFVFVLATLTAISI